jgi:GDP-L-fucose synthase
VGGIQANIENPATFLLDNLQMQNNVIKNSLIHKVKKFVFLGSSCIYPKDCPQPMREEYLLTGKLEPTNEGYALAKIAGIKLLQYYKTQYGFNGISLIPCNLYGPNDSFDLKNSHVLSALVKKFIDALDRNDDSITLWGTGNARREFMHVDDLAKAISFMLENYNEKGSINIGTGYDISIFDLSKSIADKLGYKGEIIWDKSKPDGMLRKCMNIRHMEELGFRPKITLVDGIEQMINIYKGKKGKV